ncbi:MAG: GNAT family N-acetyltransferase [Promethearchaeota archaeon]
MLKLYEISEFSQFVELRKKWNNVLSRSLDNSLFLTWEQFAVSAQNLKENQSLRILYVANTENIVAIAPLRKSSYSFKGGFTFDIIEPLDYGTSTDYTGLIITEQETECLLLFLKFLYSQNDWDFIYLSDIPEKSRMVDLLVNNNHLLPNFEIEKGAICPYIKIPNSLENFLRNYGKNFRKNLRRGLRNLERDHGKIELKDHRDMGSIKDAMNIFFNLHQKRWLSKNQPGAFSTKRVRNIFLDRARLFAQKGWFRLYFLLVDKKPVAAKYVLEHNKKIYGCLSGFDSDYSSYSLGNLLMVKIIEKAIERGFKEYDFMKGNELYKSKWTKNYRRNVNIKFINNRFKSRIMALFLEVGKRLRIDII